jgi:hypothetical protein
MHMDAHDAPPRQLGAVLRARDGATKAVVKRLERVHKMALQLR